MWFNFNITNWRFLNNKYIYPAIFKIYYHAVITYLNFSQYIIFNS